jgi:hypothetical protein
VIAAWPFGDDADEHDPLTALRIPVVGSFKPQWGFIGAFLKTDPGSPFDPPWPFASAERPTDAEARMLVSYIEEAKSHLRGGYIAKMEQRPLDVDNWSCGHVFIKYGTDDWGYRRNSWIYGATFVPDPPNTSDREGPLTLEQVMDRCYSIGGEPMAHWADWKKAHPEVFPA